MTHTVTPYQLIGSQGTAIWAGDEIIASVDGARADHRKARANAEFIVRACNAHDDLVAALKNLLGYADAMHRAEAREEGREIDYATFPEARAALSKAGAK